MSVSDSITDITVFDIQKSSFIFMHGACKSRLWDRASKISENCYKLIFEDLSVKFRSTCFIHSTLAGFRPFHLILQFSSDPPPLMNRYAEYEDSSFNSSRDIDWSRDHR